MMRAGAVLGSEVPTVLSCPVVLEGLLSPPLTAQGCLPCPRLSSSLPFQVLTLRKLEWGAEVVQLEMCYTQHGLGPEGAHPGRRQRCPWWGRGNWSLREEAYGSGGGKVKTRPRVQPCSPFLLPPHPTPAPVPLLPA